MNDDWKDTAKWSNSKIYDEMMLALSYPQGRSSLRTPNVEHAALMKKILEQRN